MAPDARCTWSWVGPTARIDALEVSLDLSGIKQSFFSCAARSSQCIDYDIPAIVTIVQCSVKKKSLIVLKTYSLFHTVLKATPISASTIYLALDKWLLVGNQYRITVFAITFLRWIFIHVREEVKKDGSSWVIRHS